MVRLFFGSEAVTLCGILAISCLVATRFSAAADDLQTAVGSDALRVSQNQVQISITSSTAPTWKVIIDRRKGGVITDLRIPATGENLAAADGDRFEGICNLVYVDFIEQAKHGSYLAKGTYSYFGTVSRFEVEVKSPERVVVVVEGKAGNQGSPQADVVRYRQRYTFLPDRVVCAGEVEWLFDDVVPESHPELLQLNCKLARDAVNGEMRVWGQAGGPVVLPQTNSKGANYPPGIDYPWTVEVPLTGGNALQIRSLELSKDFVQAKFYWNEFPHQIDGQRGFAFKAWEGYPGNGDVKFSRDEPIRYSYELLPRSAPDDTASALPPYPPSRVIRSAQFDWSTLKREAPGSDNWPTTWADDGHQYAAWGDGGGFGGTNSLGRASLGIARIEGGWDDPRGHNVWGGQKAENPATFSGKSYGMICVNGVFAMWTSPEYGKEPFRESRLAVSTDHGASWKHADWSFTRDQNVMMPTICQFGRDYAGARDDYVYNYLIRFRSLTGPDDYPDRAPYLVVQRPGAIDLARVPKDRMLDRQAWTFFAGREETGAPIWTSDLSKRRPVFEDANGVGWNVGVSSNAGLKRYLLCTEHGQSHRGKLGIFDAPEPWGPWTTVAYEEAWGEGVIPVNTFCWYLPTKWISDDGRSFSLTFSGRKENDAWNTLRGAFVTD